MRWSTVTGTSAEQGAQLGIIRTQELLAARRIDGAQQFFTRAIDFGFTRTPEETLQKWGRERLLSDMVWVIRSYRPDVIISDIKMPFMDGYQLIKAIRALPELSQTPVIALTGFGAKADVERALAAGFNACVCKPAEPAKLASVIDQLIARAASMQLSGDAQLNVLMTSKSLKATRGSYAPSCRIYTLRARRVTHALRS